jgi:hypothetical protein
VLRACLFSTPAISKNGPKKKHTVVFSFLFFFAQAFELSQRLVKALLCRQRRIADVAPAAHVPFAEVSGQVTRL